MDGSLRHGSSKMKPMLICTPAQRQEKSWMISQASEPMTGVTGFGTGGTLKGVARVLAKERPETKVRGLWQA